MTSDSSASFDLLVLPHLDAAYSLARWLTGNDRDAEDATQEACLRALKFAAGFRGGNARSWFLKIVRHTTWTWLKRNRAHREEVEFDEELHGGEDFSTNPETILMRQADIAAVRQALEHLAPEFREAMVLREIEGCSYKEIAEIADVPLGTVMSRLARGRQQLQSLLVSHTQTGGLP